MSITIKQLADKLGTSTATVSRVLNDRPGVSAEMRQRVLQAAQELKFRPSAAARALSTSRSRSVAFIVRKLHEPWSADPFYPLIMMGAQRELAANGYGLFTYWITAEELDAGTHFSWFDERSVDGLIIAGPELSNPNIIRLASLGLPVVLAANASSRYPIDSLSSADREGGYTATTHLIGHGHRHIVHLSGPPDWYPNSSRRDGYLQAMQEHDLEPKIIIMPRLEIEQGTEAFSQAVQRYPEVTAIFSTNDGTAIGAVRAAKELGRRVPEDLAVVGFDDVYWATLFEPSLTTLSIQKEQIGRLAANRLLEMLKHGQQRPVRSYVENELIIRSSCGCPKAVAGELPEKEVTYLENTE
ncbi:MAG: LacI family transcriptional regulator [Chloroflexota bacterium]|nr:MAG: LacI family transcriptional regulator [Chloroflexota bacterium]